MNIKKIAGIILILLIALGGVLGVIIFKKSKNTSVSDLTSLKIKKETSGRIASGNQPAGKFTQSEIIFSHNKGKRFLNIAIGKNKIAAAGISIRAEIKLQTDPLAAFKDADPQKKGIQLKTSGLLKKSNWMYPINRIVFDRENKRAFIEIAMVNVGIKPTSIKPGEVLATVEFSPQLPPQKITLKFDQTKTQVLNKNGKKNQLILKDIIYEIK